MAPTKKNSTFSALESVHAALKPLDPSERQRVLTSIYALLEISEGSVDVKPPSTPGGSPGAGSISTPVSLSRPVAIRELIQEKKPRSNPQFITLFAYYREKHENLPTFSRGELEEYYARSRENPPKNYVRDFLEAVKRGWIHEDGANSYITSKGLEAVESSFSDSEDKPGRKAARKSRRSGKKTLTRKSTH